MSAIKEMFYKHMSPSKLISKFDGFATSKENQEDLQNENPNELNLLEKPASILKVAGSPAISCDSNKNALTSKSVRFSDNSSPNDSEEEENAVQASITNSSSSIVPKKLNIDVSNLNGIQKARHLLRSVSPNPQLPVRRCRELPRKTLFQDSDSCPSDLSSDSTQPNSPVTVSSSYGESSACKLDTHVSMSPSTRLSPTDARIPLSDIHLDCNSHVSLAENEVTVSGKATPPPPRYVYIPARPFSPLSLLDKKVRQRIPETISTNEWCSTPTIHPVFGSKSNINVVNEALSGDSQIPSTSVDEETSTDEEELWTQKLSSRRFRRSARSSKRVHFANAEVFAEKYTKEFGYEDITNNEFKIQ